MKKKEINSSRVPVYRDSGFELYNAGLTSESFKKETENEREPENYMFLRLDSPIFMRKTRAMSYFYHCIIKMNNK